MSAVPVYGLSDWGTTRFRLCLVDGAGNVISEKRSDDGLDISRTKGFAAVLEGHLASLDAPADLNAILSGSVKIGDMTRDVRIIPGLCQSGDAPNVMRGEETQLLGAILERNLSNGIIAMPGTHSKWVELEQGRATAFSTYLTGELYALLGQQSILRHSILDAVNQASPDHPEFVAALKSMLSGGSLLGQLFGIRAAMLLSDLPREGAASRLSGLLIGAEIAGARSELKGRITLVASGAMAVLYGKALAVGGIEFDLVNADEAVRKGLFVAASGIWPNEKEISA